MKKLYPSMLILALASSAPAQDYVHASAKRQAKPPFVGQWHSAIEIRGGKDDWGYWDYTFGKNAWEIDDGSSVSEFKYEVILNPRKKPNRVDLVELRPDGKKYALPGIFQSDDGILIWVHAGKSVSGDWRPYNKDGEYDCRPTRLLATKSNDWTKIIFSPGPQPSRERPEDAKPLLGCWRELVVFRAGEEKWGSRAFCLKEHEIESWQFFGDLDKRVEKCEIKVDSKYPYPRINLIKDAANGKKRVLPGILTLRRDMLVWLYPGSYDGDWCDWNQKGQYPSRPLVTVADGENNYTKIVLVRCKLHQQGTK